MVIPTLALDLGTKTGWALQAHGGVILSGTFDNTLSQRERALLSIENADWDRTFDPRFKKLFFDIQQTIAKYGIRKLVFEDVQFSAYTLQTQLWSTFRAAVWAQGLGGTGLVFGSLNTATLKLVATGKGNATKAMMAAWLVKKYPDRFRKLAAPNPAKDLYVETLDGRAVDDNEVDAFHLLKYFTHAER